MLVLFSSLSCVLSSAADTIDNVRPPVTVVFRESVVLINYFLENLESGEVFPVEIAFQQANKTFTFVPARALSNGRYRFSLFASDLIGNTQRYTYEFEVFVAGTRIFLIEPNSIGVANSTTFRVTIYTSRTSVCKYTGVSILSFDDIRLKLFDITGNISTSRYVNDHSINAYSVEPDFPRNFYVVCKDDLGRENLANFKLYADVTPPSLTGVLFSPSPVVEYPPVGDLASVLKVTASEPVLCKYTKNENATYSDMIAFEGYNIDDFDAYLAHNEQTMFFPGDVVKDTFTYYVQCEDRARFLSAKVVRPITIDLSEGLVIRVLSPPAMSRNTSVFLNLTTNRRAYCVYKSPSPGEPSSYTDPNAKLSSSFEELSTVHYKRIGTKAAGNYALTIRCDVPEGVGIAPMTAETTYNYVIDTTPPSVPRVNATTPVCTDVLSASFVANDTQSGISEYRWAVGTAGNIMANGSASANSISVSKSNNGSAFVMSDQANYIFSVLAVDGAGNIGSAGTSNQIKFDSTGMGCDKTPPVITVVKSPTGDSASIECFDNQSGCASIGSFYGTAYEQPCDSTQYFLYPVIIPLFRTTIVCWNIRDNAGNINSGSDIVDLNVSTMNISGPACPSGIDSDGDGYGERCLLGPDCNDMDSGVSVGCANGCIQDLDGDGYGIGCSAGNDCNGRESNLTTKCPNNCISDNDGDEFGLGCDNGPDCKGDDSTLTINCPNGCIDDNDGDGYGLNCPAGYDCDGENRMSMRDCDNLCIQDTDSDDYGVGCTIGLDCNGRQPSLTRECTNRCVFDEDGDGYGFLCMKGLDCNGMNPFMYIECANNCVSDNDGDSYGWKCDNGADCNDTDPYVNLDCSMTTDCKYDHDGDGFGLGCKLGADCDDYDASVLKDCTENCTYDADCNGLPDYWQERYFNNTICNDTAWCGPDADPDADSFTNIEEYRRDTNPLQKETVALPTERPSEALDADGDGMPDACERMYGLNPADPFDNERDNDADGLDNKFECSFREGLCTQWLNPTSPDTDNDGYSDSQELDAGTDPCDPGSKPSNLLPWILIILGLLAILGSTSYLIYKKYYVPLVSPPPKPVAAPKPAAAPAAGAVRQQGALPGVQQGPRRVPPHFGARPGMRPGVRATAPSVLSRSKFEDEMRKREQERERILSVFGARRALPTQPSKVMEELARRPADARHVRFARAVLPGVQRPVVGRPPVDDHIARLSKIVGEDYFDKISALTRTQADYFSRLAEISKEKEVSLEEDQVSKLASITRRVSEDIDKKKELETAFKKAGMEDLDAFLSSRKHIDTFIKEYVPEKKDAGRSRSAEESDAFADLSKLGSGKKEGIDALESLSSSKRKDVIGALNDMASRRAQQTALSKIDELSAIDSKEELFKAFSSMSKERHVDRDVFEVLLSYLLKSGKVTKADVSEILFSLEGQGVLSKKDIADVFFNLGIKR